MNTPRKTKRFSLERWKQEYWGGVQKGSGHFSVALDSPEFGNQFALLVTEFTHLEFAMERVLGVLLQVDSTTAAHVMRSILSVKARIAMMRAVLQRARHTATFPDEFDDILDEFQSINSLRNDYVHGRWFTDINTGTVYIIKPNEDPLIADMSAMNEIKVSELEVVRNRIVQLQLKISLALARHFESTQPAE